jgi:hypothetical protein
MHLSYFEPSDPDAYADAYTEALASSQLNGHTLGSVRGVSKLLGLNLVSPG